MLAHPLERRFFEPADLRLADADLRCDLRLRLSAEESQLEYPPLPVREPVHPVRQQYPVEPALVGLGLVPDLVDDIDRIAVVAVKRLVQRNGVSDRVKGEDDLRFRNAEFLCDLLDTRLRLRACSAR